VECVRWRWRSTRVRRCSPRRLPSCRPLTVASATAMRVRDRRGVGVDVFRCGARAREAARGWHLQPGKRDSGTELGCAGVSGGGGGQCAAITRNGCEGEAVSDRGSTAGGAGRATGTVNAIVLVARSYPFQPSCGNRRRGYQRFTDNPSNSASERFEALGRSGVRYRKPCWYCIRAKAGKRELSSVVCAPMVAATSNCC